jgi:predicted nucleic acid-binding protein
MWSKSPLTFDTSVAIYAFAGAGTKATAARSVIERADFASVQVLNEFANAVRRKQDRPWPEIRTAIDRLRMAVPSILPIDETAHLEATRLADRYKIGIYDALVLAVALIGKARTFYTEDMQHGMTIDETLRVANPFLPGALDQ